MQISKYFTLEDLTKTDQNADNTPDADAINNLLNFGPLLDEIYEQIGPFEIHSAYRSPAVNALVGGAEGSLHGTGQAIDLTPTTMSIRDYFAKIYGSDFRDKFGEIILKESQNALHLSEPTLTKVGVPMTLENGVYRRMSASEVAQIVGQAVADAGESVSRDVVENPARTTAILVLIAAIGFLYFRSKSQTKPVLA